MLQATLLRSVGQVVRLARQAMGARLALLSLEALEVAQSREQLVGLHMLEGSSETIESLLGLATSRIVMLQVMPQRLAEEEVLVIPEAMAPMAQQVLLAAQAELVEAAVLVVRQMQEGSPDTAR